MHTIEMPRELFEKAVEATLLGFPAGEADHPGYAVAPLAAWNSLSVALHARRRVNAEVVVLDLTGEERAAWAAIFEVMCQDEEDYGISDAEYTVIADILNGED